MMMRGGEGHPTSSADWPAQIYSQTGISQYMRTHGTLSLPSLLIIPINAHLLISLPIKYTIQEPLHHIVLWSF